MFLSAVKLTLLAHSLLLADLGTFIKGTFESNSRSYQSAMRNLASLATSKEVTLKVLKVKVQDLAYFNFRNNSNAFAEAIFEARKRLISEAKQRITDEEGETVDVTSDKSTSIDLDTEQKDTAKDEKAE